MDLQTHLNNMALVLKAFDVMKRLPKAKQWDRIHNGKRLDLTSLRPNALVLLTDTGNNGYLVFPHMRDPFTSSVTTHVYCDRLDKALQGTIAIQKMVHPGETFKTCIPGYRLAVIEYLYYFNPLFLPEPGLLDHPFPRRGLLRGVERLCTIDFVYLK